jgi:hypothetical protein
MHPASAQEFQALRIKMVSEWTPQMMHVLGIDFGSLPIIWDADFLYGPRDASGRDTYLLCEINVSSVFSGRSACRDRAPRNGSVGIEKTARGDQLLMGQQT